MLFKRNTPNKAAAEEGPKDANHVKEKTQKATTKATPPPTPTTPKEKQKKKVSPQTSPSAKPKKKEENPIVEIKKRYDEFVKKLDAMILMFKKRRELMVHCRKADNEIFRQMMSWTKGTPLAQTLEDSANPSYSSVNSALDTTSRTSEDVFQEKVIDYATEWKKLVTLSFMSEYDEYLAAEKNLEHYTKKVGTLRSNHSKVEASGKETPPQTTEKLDRNEEKLEDAKKSHEKLKRHLIYLADELIEHAWKDAYPLFMQIFHFQVNDAQDRAMILSDLHDVMAILSKRAGESGIDPHENHSTTELWRKIRFQWHDQTSQQPVTTGLKSSPVATDKRDQVHFASKDVDIDLRETTPDSSKRGTKDKDHGDKDETESGVEKFLAPEKASLDKNDHDVDDTSFTEQMLEDDISEHSWSHGKDPLAV